MNTPKYIRERQVIFDIETVPCIKTGERVLIEAEEAAEMAQFKEESYSQYIDAVKTRMRNLTSSDKPRSQGLVKFLFNKVVAISCIIREGNSYDSTANIKLMSFPLKDNSYEDLDDVVKSCELFDEATMIKDFFLGIGANGNVKKMPQLIGMSSKFFDLPVLTQRALVNGLQIPHFFNRPDKPWEGVDYINNFSEDHLDVFETFSCNNFLSKYRLNQICRAQGIPGKIGGLDGENVDQLYTDRQFKQIVQYCETDVFSTYLLFLNTLKLTNKISREAHLEETKNFWLMIEKGAAKKYEHYIAYQDEYKRLNN